MTQHQTNTRQPYFEIYERHLEKLTSHTNRSRTEVVYTTSDHKPSCDINPNILELKYDSNTRLIVGHKDYITQKMRDHPRSKIHYR